MSAPVLYTHPSRPTSWITPDADGVTLIEWPADADGWTRRTTYTGPREGLVEVWPGSAAGTGWPREAGARKVPYHTQRPARRGAA